MLPTGVVCEPGTAELPINVRLELLQMNIEAPVPSASVFHAINAITPISHIVMADNGLTSTLPADYNMGWVALKHQYHLIHACTLAPCRSHMATFAPLCFLLCRRLTRLDFVYNPDITGTL